MEFLVIVPGCEGIGLTVTFKVCGKEDPQELLAMTVIFPVVAPAVAFIELVMDEPVQPSGNVHV